MTLTTAARHWPPLLLHNPAATAGRGNAYEVFGRQKDAAAAESIEEVGRGAEGEGRACSPQAAGRPWLEAFSRRGARVAPAGAAAPITSSDLCSSPSPRSQLAQGLEDRTAARAAACKADSAGRLAAAQRPVRLITFSLEQGRVDEDEVRGPPGGRGVGLRWGACGARAAQPS
jgi:hypothetical protein